MPKELEVEPFSLARKRIKVVFEELRRKHGFFARMNYMCCQTCGCAAISQSKPKKKYYVFYHQQDADRAEETGEVMLAFGAINEGDGSVAAGNIIANAMRFFGLDVNWDGTENQRIAVSLRRN